MATVEELKAMIVELKMSLAKNKVRDGWCPYGVLDGLKDPRREFGYDYCYDRDCMACENEVWAELRKKYEDEVAGL